MSRLDRFFDNYLKEIKDEENLEQGVVWEEDPVTFEEFVKSKEHMAFPPYSERQLDAMNYLLGTDPKNTFNNGVSLGVLTWGKGCLSKECILEDAFTHENFTVKELADKNKSIFIHCYDEEKGISTIEKASVPWISGKGEIFEVKTESGKSINVYKHHQFLTKNGWKKLSELNIGDEILDDSIKYKKIVSINYLRDDVYYDLEVDKYHNYLAHGLYNHNSGKDTISCHAVLYCVYLLLCCKNPHKLFRGIDSTSYMDIVNVAYNRTQSNQVFFTKLVEATKNWKWLREKYKFVESGKSKKLDKKYENEEIINIKAEEIVFPKHIRAVSRCSQQNAAEGLNVLLWILDEFSAFSDKNNKSNAMEMFNTLKSSSVTRFGNQSKGFVISFPRYKDDPIQKLSKMYEDDLGAYVDKASTFEVKPKSCFCDNWVEWKGRMIPEDFLSEFTRDPENALAKYFCEPPEMSDPYFTELAKIDACVDENKKPILEVRSNIVEVNGEKLYRNEIIGKNYSLPDTNFVIGGDIGLTNDLTSISLWHSETSYLGNGQSITYYVQDLKIDWIPNKLKGIKVDTENVDKIIEEIIWKYNIPVINVYFDHFNTALILQKLRNRGVNGQAYVLTAQDFYDIRTKIYDGRIKFLNDQEQILEIKRLRNTNSGKPDHTEDGHDDRFRASCLAIVALSGGGKNATITSNDDGIYINKKLNPEEGMSDLDFEGETIKGNFHNGNVIDEEDDILNNYFDV
ncbi:MAG: hypothetical protein NC222_06600 [Staphylococcus sp.]|nr:hypothetical protein [Staphylococcus sp.]